MKTYVSPPRDVSDVSIERNIQGGAGHYTRLSWTGKDGGSYTAIAFDGHKFDIRKRDDVMGFMAKVATVDRASIWTVLANGVKA